MRIGAIPLSFSYATKAIVKDDSEGKAYITTNSTGVVPDEYNAISAWVVDSKGTKITNSIYLKSNTRKTATYYGGYNLPGSYYNLKVHYSYNPQLVPQKTHVNIRWCP